jgi:pSer/pThr/pTyr-binding forkhead associated (FHA) protein
MFDYETQSDDTVMLGYENAQQERRIRPHLIRQSNNERITIDKQLFRIGRDRSFVDYCISENTAIGRSHAHIVVRGGVYYIMDMNSKNHTYVNGEMITGSTEVEIGHETKIRLANEEFEFRLY